MIVFDLRCRSEGHVFEGWFGSSAAYEDQLGRGLVQCPLCGAADIEKAVTAARLGAKGNQKADAGSASAAYADPASVKEMTAAMAAAQKKLLENASYVGDRFADQARAMHLGEIESRSIYGKTTAAESESLLEEGIPVAPLPFPVVEPGTEN
jgi:hypothetical protein